MFDTDSVGLLKMLSEMNSGMRLEGVRGDQVLKPTRFFPGAVVNNHKRYEREVMPQYFKLEKKIRNGAGFIINQIGYDSRKQDELLKYMARCGLRTPAIANVYVLSPASARFFHGGNIPGVIVTDELLELTGKHARSRDKGKAFFLEFAAKQCAIARGLGYRGVYLGGHLKFEDYARILDICGGYGDADWKDFASEICFQQPEEFFFFEPDRETGLSSDEVNRAYRHSKQPEVLRAARSRVSTAYKINRFVHEQVFEKDRPAFRIGRRFFEAVDRAGRQGAQGFARSRAGGENSVLRLPGLRRLFAARYRVPLSRVAVRQESAKRPLRRDPPGTVRSGGEGMHLVAGLRTAEGVRRGRDNAGRAGGLQKRRPQRHQRLGERVSGTGPPRTQRMRGIR